MAMRPTKLLCVRSYRLLLSLSHAVLRNEEEPQVSTCFKALALPGSLLAVAQPTEKVSRAGRSSTPILLPLFIVVKRQPSIPHENTASANPADELPQSNILWCFGAVSKSEEK